MKTKLNTVNTVGSEAYGYGRFSSKPQERGDSFERQTKWIKSEADTLKVNLVNIFFDESTSGKAGLNLEREFGELLKVLRPGHIVLVEDADRLSRQNPLVVGKMIYDIVQRGVEIRFKDGQVINKENIDSIATNLPLYLKSTLGHAENVKKIDRLRLTWLDKFDSVIEDNKPFPHYGPCWLKYNWDTKAYNYDEKKIDTVKYIFSLVKQKIGLLKVVNRLNNEKRPLVTTRTKTKHWSRTTVNKIVKNKAVYGALELTDGRIKENHYRSIVDKDLFYSVQDGLSERRKIGTGRPSPFFNVYKGILKCSDCGGNLMLVRKHKPNKTYNYLVCHSKVIGVCKPYTALDYESFDTSFLIQLSESSDLVERVFASPLDNNKSASIEGELTTIKNRLNKIQVELESGAVELSSTVDRVINNLEKKIKTLTTELEIQRSKELESTKIPNELNSFFQSIHDDGETISNPDGHKVSLNIATNEHLSNTLKTFIQYITVNVMDKTYTVTFKDPKSTTLSFEMLDK